MRVMIIGGMGFIGESLSRRLLSEDYSIAIYDRVEANIEGVESIVGDFSNEKCWDKILEGIDVVYHLVSTTVPSSSNKDIPFDIMSNVIGSVNLLDAVSRNKNIKKIIFISSGGTIYGEGYNNPIKEEDQTNPICSYGIHKLTIEKYLNYFNKAFGLNYNVIRLGNPFGIRKDTNNGQGVIPIFINKVLNNDKISIWGNDQIIRDYIFIDDVIEALMKVMYYNGEESVFNLGTGMGYSLNEIIENIESALDKKANVEVIESRGYDVDYNVLCIDKIMKELDWKPKVSLVDGIRLICENLNI